MTNLTDDQLAEFEAAAEGQLTAEQQRTFEANLAANADLQAEWTAYRQLRYALESVHMKKQLMALHQQALQNGQLDDADVPEISTNVPAANVPDASSAGTLVRPLPTVRRVSTWWAVAAGLALVLGTWWWLSRQPYIDTQALFVAHYRPEPVVKGGSDCGPAVAEVIRLYRAKQYETALQQLSTATPTNVCVPYYRGLCQLALGEPRPAVENLEQASQQSRGALRQRAEWFLALAYLRNNDPQQAKRQLEAIVRQSEHGFRQKASEVLPQLP